MPRIAVISDIHGNLAALEAVAADIRARRINTVVNLGDSLSGPLLPRETARFLMERGWPAIAGNHERHLLELRAGHAHGPADRFAAARLDEAGWAWIAGLPVSLRFGELLACHGTPDNDHHWLLETVRDGRLQLPGPDVLRARLQDTHAAAVACGHSHVPRIVRVDDRLLLNPGSVGMPAYRDDRPDPYVVDAGAPDARYAVLACEDGRWRAELVAVPYDHAAMATLAARNGFPQWAYALASGYAPPRTGNG